MLNYNQSIHSRIDRFYTNKNKKIKIFPGLNLTLQIKKQNQWVKDIRNEIPPFYNKKAFRKYSAIFGKIGKKKNKIQFNKSMAGIRKNLLKNWPLKNQNINRQQENLTKNILQ